ncbi:MAG: SAM-dependent methyltransferase [Firmicutes bacterium]|nr:SAM-dependent methyltransferase [Bacillota bacterium]
MADVGTDHGFLPLFLWQKGICPHVILCDVNEGPLAKAKGNLEKLVPGEAFDLRLGSGLEPFGPEEADTVVIAGMGGLLIADILDHDLEKTRNFKKLILQPRNAQDKLRQYLWEKGLPITAEKLVREGRYICEILVVEPAKEWTYKPEHPVDFLLSPLLFREKDPLLGEFTDRKIRMFEEILSARTLRSFPGEDEVPTEDLMIQLEGLKQRRKDV